MKPNRVVAVDWSGARTGERRKIWLCEIFGGRVERLVDGWSRGAVTEELVRIARRAQSDGERVIIGLDFSFAFPAWYAAQCGWLRGRDVWRAWTPELIEQVLTTPAFPFWGRGAQRQKPPALHNDSDTPPLRATELTTGPRPFSVFQLVGAGAVGPASLRGMVTLHALASAGARIWPFESDAGGVGALVLEIWPRLYAPHVNKSDAGARLNHVRSLASWGDQLAAHEVAVRNSDDAFDALIGALALWQARARLASLGAAANEMERLEGRIWRP